MLRKKINTNLLNLAIDAFEEEDFMIPITVTGDSMSPLFVSDHTIVQLGHKGIIKKGDVVLFRTADDHFVLHRIIKINTKTKQVITRGDHNVRCDDPIRLEDIKAKVLGFYHEDKYCKLSSFYAWRKFQQSNIRRLLVQLYMLFKR